VRDIGVWTVVFVVADTGLAMLVGWMLGWSSRDRAQQRKDDRTRLGILRGLDRDVLPTGQTGPPSTVRPATMVRAIWKDD
jgi:hypothetical protein